MPWLLFKKKWNEIKTESSENAHVDQTRGSQNMGPVLGGTQGNKNGEWAEYSKSNINGEWVGYSKRIFLWKKDSPKFPFDSLILSQSYLGANESLTPLCLLSKEASCLQPLVNHQFNCFLLHGHPSGIRGGWVPGAPADTRILGCSSPLYKMV